MGIHVARRARQAGQLSLARQKASHSHEVERCRNKKISSHSCHSSIAGNTLPFFLQGRPLGHFVFSLLAQ